MLSLLGGKIYVLIDSIMEEKTFLGYISKCFIPKFSSFICEIFQNIESSKQLIASDNCVIYRLSKETFNENFDIFALK